MYCILKTGSVTNSQRAMKLLRSNGYKPSMSRNSKPAPGEGCGYMVKFSCSDDSAEELLLSDGINIIGVEYQ